MINLRHLFSACGKHFYRKHAHNVKHCSSCLEGAFPCLRESLGSTFFYVLLFDRYKDTCEGISRGPVICS